MLSTTARDRPSRKARAIPGGLPYPLPGCLRDRLTVVVAEHEASEGARDPRRSGHVPQCRPLSIHHSIVTGYPSSWRAAPAPSALASQLTSLARPCPRARRTPRLDRPRRAGLCGFADDDLGGCRG